MFGANLHFHSDFISTIFKPTVQNMIRRLRGHENLANVAALMFYLLRAFPENLKQLSSILTNIWRFEATYVILFGT